MEYKCPKCNQVFEPCSECRAQRNHQQCVNDPLCHDCTMKEKWHNKAVESARSSKQWLGASMMFKKFVNLSGIILIVVGVLGAAGIPLVHWFKAPELSQMQVYIATWKAWLSGLCLGVIGIYLEQYRS